MTLGPVNRSVIVAASVGLVLPSAGSLEAQRLLDYTPNTRAAWSFTPWQPALILSHRFELLSGGDEVLNVPLITLGAALRERVAVGLDFTTNSETTARDRGGNEAQWWIAAKADRGRNGSLSSLVAYNTAASSLDAAITGLLRRGALSIVGEGRAFSHAFGSRKAGAAAAGGAVLHLTEFLSLSGDLGRTFSPAHLETVWSAGVTFSFPGTRHHFSFHATNSSAATLQGASRRNVLGAQSTRYGFVFTAPLGSASQWAWIFGRSPRNSVAADSGKVVVPIRNLAFQVDTIRIQAGTTVVWKNDDPIAHSVTSDSRIWRSAPIEPGALFSRHFTVPGVYPYHCEPHPHMKGVVLVRPPDGD